MAPIASLGQGATEAYPRLYIRYSASLAATKIAAYLDALSLVFADDGTPAERTFSNWIVVGRGLVDQPLAVLNSDFEFFNKAVDFLYRSCLAGVNAQFSTPARISATQVTAIIAAYNATIG